LFWLSDEQWKRIEPLDVRGIERVDGRRVISGIGRFSLQGRWPSTSLHH
jgi:hypothetical protein